MLITLADINCTDKGEVKEDASGGIGARVRGGTTAGGSFLTHLEERKMMKGAEGDCGWAMASGENAEDEILVE